jgi:ATP-dependent Clp protease protease subunit
MTRSAQRPTVTPESARMPPWRPEPDRPGVPPWRPTTPPLPGPGQPFPQPWPGERPGGGFIPIQPEAPALPADVLERLLDRRIVMVGGYVDQQVATRTAAQLMLLDSDREDPVQLHLSCRDGDLDAAIMLAETVELLRVPVQAIAGGVVGGPAVAVYASAGRRLAHPHSAFQLREPHLHTEGTAEQIAGRVAQHEHQLGYLRRHLAQACGQTIDKVAADLSAGLFLPAADAVEYGLVHELVSRTPRGPVADSGS